MHTYTWHLKNTIHDCSSFVRNRLAILEQNIPHLLFSLKWSYRGCGEYSLKILPLLFFPYEHKSRCELIFLTVQLLVMFKDTTGIILQVQNECNKSFEILIMVCILCAPSNKGNKTLHCKNKSCCARNSLFPKTVNAIKLPI